MERNITGLLLLGVLSLLVWPASCSGPETSWETSNAAGMEAFQEARYAEAEKWWLAALEAAENFGPDDQRLATNINNLAGLYHALGKYAQAEPLYQRSLAIREKALGSEHPSVATSLENYGDLLRKMGRDEEAEKMEARAKAIRAKHAQENPTK